MKHKAPSFKIQYRDNTVGQSEFRTLKVRFSDAIAAESRAEALRMKHPEREYRVVPA